MYTRRQRRGSRQCRRAPAFPTGRQAISLPWCQSRPLRWRRGRCEFSHHPPVTHNDPDTISAKAYNAHSASLPPGLRFACSSISFLSVTNHTTATQKRDTHHIIPPCCATGSSFILVFCTHLSLILPMEIRRGGFYSLPTGLNINDTQPCRVFKLSLRRRN